MTVDVSDAEKMVAREVKRDFNRILKKLSRSIKIILDLRDAIVSQRPSKDDLKTKYKGRMLRYKRKIQTNFNSLLQDVQKSIDKVVEIIDPETIRLREIIIAEFDELSDGVEAIMDALSETERDGFTKRVERVSAQLEKRHRSIIDVIENQLYNHVEHDILGRLKISSIQIRIRRRKRLVMDMIKNGIL